MIADGIRRIDTQIHDHLFDLRGVGEDNGDRCLEREMDINVFRQRGAQEGEGSFHDIVELDWAAMLLTGATEREELLDEAPGAPTGREHLVQISPREALVRNIVHRQFGIPHDRRQDVVEIVGDATREGANRLKLLGYLL